MAGFALTAQEQAALAALDPDLDLAFTGGLTDQNNNVLVPRMPGYNEAAKTTQNPSDQRPTVRKALEVALVPLLRVLGLLTPSVTFIGAVGAPAFQNGWVNQASGTMNAGYYKDVTGRVWLQGCIKSGTIGAVAFQLPAGFRPALIAGFIVISNNAGTAILGQVNVDGSGNVSVLAGNNAQIFLDQISFFAAA